MKKIYCSVVVPAHNEAENLKRLVLELKSVLSKIRKKYELERMKQSKKSYCHVY